MPIDWLVHAAQDPARERLPDLRPPQQFENRRFDLVGCLNLLEFELVAPGNQRPPDQLVGGHHDQDHGRNAGHQGAHVAVIRRGLDVAAQPRQLKIAITHGEGFAKNERKPAARHRNNGIPYQPDCREWHFQLPKTLPSGISIDARGLKHLPRNGFERGIEAEGKVPDLPGKDQQNDGHLNAKLMPGDERDHGEHHGRQKAQHRNRLQDVQNRNHPWLNARVVSRNVAVADGKCQAERISNGHSHNGVKRVHRKRAD